MTDRQPEASTARDRLAAAVREHYAQVCLCEWTDDDLPLRTLTSEKCSRHGSAADPLDSLLDLVDAVQHYFGNDLTVDVLALTEANVLAALAAVEAAA